MSCLCALFKEAMGTRPRSDYRDCVRCTRSRACRRQRAEAVRTHCKQVAQCAVLLPARHDDAPIQAHGICFLRLHAHKLVPESRMVHRGRPDDLPDDLTNNRALGHTAIPGARAWLLMCVSTWRQAR
jgi:hypothetical protein